MEGEIYFPEVLLPALIPGESENLASRPLSSKHRFPDPPALRLGTEICREWWDEGRLLRPARKLMCLLVCQIHRKKFVPLGA